MDLCSYHNTQRNIKALLSHQETPVVFLKEFTDTPVQALQRAKEVLDVYLQLITQTATAVDWSCAVEYSYSYTTVDNTELLSTNSTGRYIQNHKAIGFLTVIGQKVFYNMRSVSNVIISITVHSQRACHMDKKTV